MTFFTVKFCIYLITTYNTNSKLRYYEIEKNGRIKQPDDDISMLKLSQSANIPCILVTFDTSHDDISLLNL